MTKKSEGGGATAGVILREHLFSRDSEATSQMKSVLEIEPDHSSAANWLFNYQHAVKQQE